MEKNRSFRTSYKSGQDTGLRLELNVGDAFIDQQFSEKSGMKIIIFNQTKIPFPDEDGIDVSTGQQTNIAISRTFINRLSNPYSNCIDSNLIISQDKYKSEIIKMMKDSKQEINYNQKYCLKLCLQRYIIQECGCFDMSLPKISINSTNYTQECYTANDVSCSEEKETHFYNSNKIQYCYEECPIECKIMIYNTRVTMTNYPTRWYYELFRNNDEFFTYGANRHLKNRTLDEIKQSILMVNVYYEDIFYTNISEIPEMNFDMLLSLIGGNLGLFLGISLLSLIEFIEIFFNLMMIVLFKRH